MSANWKLPRFSCSIRSLGPNVSAIPIGQMGLKMGLFPFDNGACLIMKKAPSDSPIWQHKKRELLLPLSFLITKPIKLDLSNLHYGLHYEPHYWTQGCVIREKQITSPITNSIRDTLVPFWTNFNANGFVRWRTSVYLNLFNWPMMKIFGKRNGVCRYVRAGFERVTFTCMICLWFFFSVKIIIN